MAAQTASTVRAAAFRTRCLSLAKTCSIGFRSGEYFGRKNSLAPAERMSWARHCFVAAEIVHDDDIAGTKDGQNNLLDIGAKAHAVDRSRASIRSWRRAARKVIVFQRPSRTLVGSLSPRRPSPQGRDVCPGRK